jgi:hypothetical protein
MLRYFISILFSVLCLTAQGQDDDEPVDRTPSADSSNQLRFGFDISKPINHIYVKDREAYEFELDWYHRKELYFVAEGGWGSGSLDSSYLTYRSNNTFFRTGVSKSILTKLYPNDWDWAFVGIRYGVAFINRHDATYTIYDPVFGNVSGVTPGTHLTAHWLELVGGVKVELFKGVYVGWNIRGRFMLNGKQFKELPPTYIAGYGRGDKNSIFDYNFYLNYAIRWKRKKATSLELKD